MSTTDTTKKATIMTVLNGLLTRYDTLCRRAYSPKVNDNIPQIRTRIMDVVASLYEYDDNKIPRALYITHGRYIYRVDFLLGTFDIIGTLTVDLTLTVAPVIEVN